MVSAAGLAPAVPRFQAEHVAATPRAEDPAVLYHAGTGELQDANPGEGRGSEGSRTLSLPADSGLLR